MKTSKKAPASKQATASKKAAPAQQAESAESTGLRDLFKDGLKDIYWAEKALTKALPKMAKNATSEELVEAINTHLEVTKEQVARLEQVFETIGVKAVAKKCLAMEGLLNEATEIMESCEEGVVRDAGIIMAGQKVEHYEIATYGTLAAFARILGETEAEELLSTSLEEEKEADENLSTAADTINLEAAEGDDEEEDEDDEDEEDDDVDVEEDDEEEEAPKKK